MSRTQKTVAKPPTVSPKLQSNGWKDRLQPEEYEHLKNVFDLFDEDHSGLIDP
jgi:Ca2+-binding EF-hand superfamily protein